MTSPVVRKFEILPVRQRPPTAARVTAFLISGNWNDWHIFWTQFWLVVVDAEGKVYDVGQLKIGQFGANDAIYHRRI